VIHQRARLRGGSYASSVIASIRLGLALRCNCRDSSTSRGTGARDSGLMQEIAMSRRAALANLSALGIGATLAGLGEAQAAQGDVGRRRRKLRKIATEDACTIPEIVNALREVVRAGGSNLDLPLLKTIYDAPARTEPRDVILPASPRLRASLPKIREERRKKWSGRLRT
jgi:hypothetical protein